MLVDLTCLFFSFFLLFFFFLFFFFFFFFLISFLEPKSKKLSEGQDMSISLQWQMEISCNDFEKMRKVWGQGQKEVGEKRKRKKERRKKKWRDPATNPPFTQERRLKEPVSKRRIFFFFLFLSNQVGTLLTFEERKKSVSVNPLRRHFNGALVF